MKDKKSKNKSKILRSKECVTNDLYEIDDLSKEELLKYIEFMKDVSCVNKSRFIREVCAFIYQKCDPGLPMKDVVNNFYKIVKKYKDHLKEFQNDRRALIEGFVALVVESKSKNLDIVRYLLHILYNEKILNKRSLCEWYKDMRSSSSSSLLRRNKLLKDFMEWVAEEREE